MPDSPVTVNFRYAREKLFRTRRIACVPKFLLGWLSRIWASAVGVTEKPVAWKVAVYVVGVAGAVIVCDCAPPSDHHVNA